MSKYTMTIDGRAVGAETEDPVIDPSTGEAFAAAPRATLAQVDEAMTAAERAYATWKRDLPARRKALTDAAAALKARVDEIGALLSREQGKPLRAATGEVMGASIWLRTFANLKLEPEILADDEKRRIEVVRKPLGATVAIAPWNFPVVLLAWKLGPALLAGNTVVAKPSPFTPLSSLLVGEILRPLFPPGVLNVLSGGAELGGQLVSHPLTRKVSFTGSVMTGKKIATACADDLKRLTLELGGNDPAIVLEDVDPAKVVDDLFWSAFANSGQVCVAVKRLYVHEKVYQPIVDGLAERARTVRVGPGTDPESKLGPINNAPQVEKLAALVDDARKHGAKILAGGERAKRPGYFYPPTIVGEAWAGLRLVDEEQFGTALPVVRFSKVEEALQQANATHFGLGGSVWTADRARGEALVQELDCGTGWVNQHNDLTPIAPFGGSKWSGLGYEGGRWGYEAMTQLQVVNSRK
jgi:acyl-CoA reductase-like NAD-dependent aldehyde dehydrogenase